jgi:glycogen operon protein
LIATLLLSQGVPMLLGGDEMLRTQSGNNNAWCQDNEISWVDWSLTDKNADFLRFVRKMIALRRNHPTLRRRHFFRGNGDVQWHGTVPFLPDFSGSSRTLALSLDGGKTEREPDRDFYMAFNAWQEAIPFTIPPAAQGRHWHRVVDTALAPPLDIVSDDQGPVVDCGTAYQVSPFSLLVLVGEG